MKIPMNEIHADNDFNCRLTLTPLDVKDLADNIRKNGLLQPVVLQQYNQEDQNRTGFKYLLIAGYRRRMAHVVLDRKEILAVIHEGELEASEALILNLSENVQRKELTIKEEAHALKKVKDMGMSQARAAERIGISRGWVQLRYMLLDLPEDIQDQFTAFGLPHQNIRDLHTIYRSHNNADEGLEAAYTALNKLKDAKSAGKKNVSITCESKDTKRIRKKHEMIKMNEHILQDLGGSLVTRAIAWCCGEISDREFHEDLIEEYESRGKIWEEPKML